MRLIFRYESIKRPSPDQVFVLAKTLENGALSAKEIMAELGLNHRPSLRINYLHPALDDGYVVSLHPEKPNHPQQKYRLAEKGMNLIKNK